MQQHTLAELEQLTDDELKRADQQIRRFWLRVYSLVAECGASLDIAILAVQATDKETRSCQ